MALTKEQREARLFGIGASETAALMDLDPFKSALDVWLRKPTISRPPLAEDEPDPERGWTPADVGDVLEEGMCSLYFERTGRVVDRPQTTIVHATSRHVVASPDGLVRVETCERCKGAGYHHGFGEDGHDPDHCLDCGGAGGPGKRPTRGVEIKIVGAEMARAYWRRGLPDHVAIQAAQNMAVLDVDRWDVIALLGGTDLRLYELERDAELEAQIIETVEWFWQTHVLGDTPPEPRDAEERKRWLLARYPLSPEDVDKDDVLRVGADPEIRDLVDRLEVAKGQLALAEETVAELTSALCEHVGPHYGIQGDWGRFTWSPRPGQVAWAKVARELGASEELIEKHRGAPTRSPLLSRFKQRR